MFCEWMSIITKTNFFRININHYTRSVLDFNCFWYRFFFLSHIIRLKQEFVKFYSRHFTYRQSLKTHAEGPKWRSYLIQRKMNTNSLQLSCRYKCVLLKTLHFQGNQTRTFRKISSNEIHLFIQLKIETLISGMYR